MATQLRFMRGFINPYSAGGYGIGAAFIKVLYEFWGYCVNGTSALQSPGGMANTMSVTYSISNTTGAGVSPIVVTTTTTHALFTGQQVSISGVTGCTAANGTYQITVINTTQFSLNNTTGNGGYTGGGTINLTAHGMPTNFTEGVNVFAVGNDGYTSAQVSGTAGGDAIFTATTNNPFSGTATTLTVNQSTNYRTTIAAGSNGQVLPQSTINVASTTTASTTITIASNGVSLPTGTINVTSTTGFPSGGYLNVVTTAGTQLVLYTGITATTFTGCTGGIGSMTTGGAISIGFPGSGTINVTTDAGNQLVTYTGTSGTTFTGCTGGTGTMSTGGAVYAPIQISTTAANSYPNLGSVVVSGVLGNTTSNGTWTVTTPSYSLNNALYFGTTIGFPSNGASLPQSTINSSTTAPFTTTTGIQTLPTGTINVSATAPASTTITASSNNVALPTGTINVVSTTGFPTSGTINVATIVTTVIALPSNGAVLPQSTIFVNSTTGFPVTGTLSVADSTITTTIAAGSNGLSLPQGTINVASTTGFAASGTIFVTTSTGNQIVAYTGTTGTSFTGCSGGGGTMSTGGAVYAATSVSYTGITPISFTGVSGGTGTILVNTPIGGGPFNQTVTYTGVTATTFTGALGGVGTMFTGHAVGNTGFFNTFPTAGSVYINTTTGAQLVNYTGVSATSLTGCTGGSGNTSNGGSVFTAFSPASAYTSIAAGSNGAILPQSTINVASTSVASTTIAAGSNGQSLPQSIINVASTTGFPATGVLWVTTSGGQQVVTYTGLTTTSFTGCSGGSGTMSTGGSVSTGFPNSGYIYVTTNLGFQVVTYTGITGTTFTGCSGGSGTMSTGGPVFLGYTPTGTIYVTSAAGPFAVTYTGTTATTFTGAAGGSGTMSTGGSINASISAILSRASTLLTGNTVTASGIVGMPNANSTFLITPISNRVIALNSAFGAGAYVSDGYLTDRSNFYLNNSTPNGTWTSGGTQQALTSNMVGKTLIMWKPNSGSSEDAIYIITSVPSPNTLRVNLNTGGTPDGYTMHPSFTQRSNINYRIVDIAAATNSLASNSSTNGNYITIQFNPSAVGINPGQANSQAQFTLQGFQFGGSSVSWNIQLSPGGNWNGITFPVTGNYNIDATSVFGSQSAGFFNGGPNGNFAVTMAADPSFFLMHFKDINSGDGSSYMHIEIPTRLYPSSADTNPMTCLFRGGVFNGSVYNIGTSAGQNFGRGFLMKGTDGGTRAHYALAKSLVGDGVPTFGINLTDFRVAFNTAKGFILASDIILTLPGVTNQYSLGRARIRTIKFTSTPLPLYHRFGTPGGTQYLNIQNGVATIWDGTILPANLLYII